MGRSTSFSLNLFFYVCHMHMARKLNKNQQIAMEVSSQSTMRGDRDRNHFIILLLTELNN